MSFWKGFDRLPRAFCVNWRLDDVFAQMKQIRLTRVLMGCWLKIFSINLGFSFSGEANGKNKKFFFAKFFFLQIESYRDFHLKSIATVLNLSVNLKFQTKQKENGKLRRFNRNTKAYNKSFFWGRRWKFHVILRHENFVWKHSNLSSPFQLRWNVWGKFGYEKATAEEIFGKSLPDFFFKSSNFRKIKNISSTSALYLKIVPINYHYNNQLFFVAVSVFIQIKNSNKNKLLRKT